MVLNYVSYLIIIVGVLDVGVIFSNGVIRVIVKWLRELFWNII